MDAAKLKAATTYNAAADHFDDEPLQFWTRIGRRTIDRLELPDGATVLDIGCGAGSSAIPAAEKVGRRGQVVGVDLAERLLEIAAEKALRNGHLNVRFVAKTWSGCATRTAASTRLSPSSPSFLSRT